MFIVIKSKRYDCKEFFPLFDDYLNYVKSNYNKLNFNNDIIIEKLEYLYEKSINNEGLILSLRFDRWISSNLKFKFKNKWTLDFWLERGFGKDRFDEEILNLSEISKKRNLELNEKKKIQKITFNPNLSIFYIFRGIMFETKDIIKCNFCESDLEEVAIKSNFDYLTVWDSDYKKNKEEVINKCINFLKNKTIL
jgi:hypothetical protein